MEDVRRSMGQLFPMLTVPVEKFLRMTTVRPHEELLGTEVLCTFDESMGKAMFVSHQWISRYHPDPHFEQLPVLQKALQKLIEGTTRVTLPPVVEIVWGRLKCPKARDFRGPLYVWYDYFSCPQGESPQAMVDRSRAIDSIHHYVARSRFFVILCPSVPSSPSLSFSSWAARGWCRLERLARELAQEDGFSITINRENHPTLAWDMEGYGRAPGMAEFSFEGDKKKVGNVLVRMVWSKLQYLLEVGDLHHYRFLLNFHHKYLEGIPDLAPVESIVPCAFETEIDPALEPDAFLVQRFLHDNLFKGVRDRDSAGWSPICYAALSDKSLLVKALLKSRANANDRLTKNLVDKDLPRNLSVLSLAAAYHSNQILQILVSARASANARCNRRGTALAWAAVGDNVHAVRPLLEAKADPQIKSYPSLKLFRLAVGCGSASVAREMLRLDELEVSLRFCLHMALVFNGEIDTIACLIEASADVNERLKVPMTSTWWPILKGLRLMHSLSPSALTYLAYHHSGATPLIFSILTGKFDTVPLLVAAGARLDIANDRGKTAWYFLQEMQVPAFWNPQPDDEFEQASVTSSDTLSI